MTPSSSPSRRERPAIRINLRTATYRVVWGGTPTEEAAFARRAFRTLFRKSRQKRARELWAGRDGRAEVRALGVCEACGWQADGDNSRSIHVHHVRPRALGTNNRRSNLMALCATCHELAHALYGNTDPGDRLRLWTALLVARSAIDKGEPLSREQVLRVVAEIEAGSP